MALSQPVLRSRMGSPRVPDTSPLAPPPLTSLSCILWNVACLRTSLSELHSIVLGHSPLIICLTETHLYSFQHKYQADLRMILANYVLFFSSHDLPPTEASLVRLHRSSVAPAGTLVALHRSISSDPRVHFFPTQSPLKGLLSHVRVPLHCGHFLHIVAAYCPPAKRALHQAVHTYLTELSSTASSTHDFVIAAGDWNASICLPPAMPSALDTNFSTFVSSSGLQSVAHLAQPGIPLPTYFGYQHTLRTSCIDDFLISNSLVSHLTHACVPRPFLSTLPAAVSDHLPLQFNLPSIVSPLVSTSPPSEPAHSPCLQTPLTPTARVAASRAILSALDVPCSLLLARLRHLVHHATNDVLQNNYTPSNVRACRNAVAALVDIPAVGAEFTDLATTALRKALLVCPLKRSRLPKRFFTRSLQQRCKCLVATRHLLCLARTLVTTQARHMNSGPHVRSSLLHALEHHATALHARAILSASEYTDVLPPLPPSDDIAVWRDWASLCPTRLCTTRTAITKLHRQHATASDRRRRKSLHKLLFTRPGLANRHIFAPDLDPLAHSGITALRDPAAPDPHAPLVGPALLDHSNSFFTSAWAAPPLTPANTGPYPFDPSTPGVCDSFTLRTLAHGPGSLPSLLTTVLDPNTFSFVQSALTNNRAPGPDGIPNEILKLMPPSFMEALHLFFVLMWLTASTPTAWKHSITKLFHKRHDRMLLQNYRPIGLNNTLYKMWTRFLTNILSDFAENYGLLSTCQEGFRPQRNTIRQLQRMIFAIEDAFHFKQDLYAMYIDFTSAFNTIDHAKLRQIMLDLGFPLDAVDVVSDLYVHASSVVQLGHHGSTRAIPVGRGSIQGDILSPFIFLIFLEPLLRWLKVGARGYRFQSISAQDQWRTTLASPAFADDLALLASNPSDLARQFDKVVAYCLWANLLVNPAKCAVTAILHASRPTCPTDALHIAREIEDKFSFNGVVVPYLHPNKTYPYLGCLLSLTLDWKPHFRSLVDSLLDKAKHLLASQIPPLRALSIVQNTLKAKLTYSFGVAPFSISDLEYLDTLLVRLTKMCMDLPLAFPNRAVLAPVLCDGLGLTSLLHDYKLTPQLSFAPLTTPMTWVLSLGPLFITTASAVVGISLFPPHVHYSHNIACVCANFRCCRAPLCVLNLSAPSLISSVMTCGPSSSRLNNFD